MDQKDVPLDSRGPKLDIEVSKLEKSHPILDYRHPSLDYIDPKLGLLSLNFHQIDPTEGKIGPSHYIDLPNLRHVDSKLTHKQLRNENCEKGISNIEVFSILITQFSLLIY